MASRGIQRLRAALRSPLGTPLARVAQGNATCLMYHRIAAGGARGAYSPNLDLFVAEEEFDHQMRHLAANHECLALSEAVELLEQRKLPRRAVVVTFDDGYRDNLRAVPILRQYRVPATIFITTGAVRRERPLWWDEVELILGRVDRLDVALRGVTRSWDLSSDELKSRAFADIARVFKGMPPAQQEAALVALRAKAGSDRAVFDDDTILSTGEVAGLDREPLITIGAHTVDHHVMRQLAPEDLRAQLTTSRAQLEALLGHPVEHFAYPFGGEEHAAGREFRAARAAGFRSAVTTRPGHWRNHPRSNLHALPRIAIDFSDTMDDFEWKLSGLFVATAAALRIAHRVVGAVRSRPRRRAAPPAGG